MRSLDMTMRSWAGRATLLKAQGVRQPAKPDTAVFFVSAPTQAAANGLKRKLPHSGKYSWLVLGGDEPDNETKGEWPVTQSPLALDLAAHGPLPGLPAVAPLAELPSPQDPKGLTSSAPTSSAQAAPHGP